MNILQRFVSFGCLGPLFQLLLEEILNFIGIYLVLPEQIELLASLDFESAKVVLVGIVLVDFVLTECSVAIALPTAAEIDLVVDAAYAIAATNHQAQSIVLAIAGIGDLQLSQDRREESPRSTQAVDAQSIVAAILERPFAMVYEAWRKRVQLEIAHPIRANHHSRSLGIESVHHSLESLGRTVEVVAVELHHETPYQRMMHGCVPATANTQIAALRNDMNK